MKLLKKIAPFAITAMFLGLPLVGALNIADWKTQFSAANTAVVVGTGVTDAGDIAAALTVAKDVGIDTSSSTVTGESYKFERSSDKLNVGDALTDIRSSITKDQLPTTLADSTYKDAESSEYDYTQKISVGTSLDLAHFAQSDYNDKAPTLGIYIPDGTHVMNYTLTFSDKPTFDDTTMETSTITMMGKDYYISGVGTHELDLLDSSTSGIVKEGETGTIGGEAIKVEFVNGGTTQSVKLNIGGTITNSLTVGSTYKLPDGKYVGVKDIMYTSKDTGTSSAELTVGNGKIKVVSGENVKINDKTVDGLTGYIGESGSDISTITFSWDTTDDSFVTPDSSITMPGLEAVKLMMTGMTFPTGEEIKVQSTGSSDIATVNLPFKDGSKDIDLLYAASAGHYGYIGGDDQKLLVTSRINYLVYNKTADAKYFVASYNTTTSTESCLLSLAFDNGDNKVDVKNEVTGTTVCTGVTQTGTCDIGDVELTLYNLSDDYANWTINSGGSFDRVFTDTGALIYLPYNAYGGHGGINLSNSSQNTAWVMEMVEADKDGNIGAGEKLNFTYGFDTSNDVSVTSISTGTLSGTSFYKQSNDYYVGYVESDLATKVEWDKTSDQYTAKATYYGEEVYGNVFLAAAGAGAGSTSWTPVQDSETAKYTSKNIVAIGGTAVNQVARKMLGLDVNTPVYGTDSAWTSATGVDAVGKGILWMQNSPYTDGTGKYALLVAGYSGSDTEKVANFLDLKTLPAKDKAVIDTTTLVAAA